MIVSVIVPVYNVEKYLQYCIDSILAQTYQKLDILLVDDGSEDSSGEICDAYAKKDARIHVIHKENAGLGYARNSGLEIASGEYVTFVDSDDALEKDAILKLVEAVHSSGADTVIGGYSRVDSQGNIFFQQHNAPECIENEDVLERFFPRLLGSAPNKKDAFRCSVWNNLYSMKYIREHHLMFPSEREYISEDIVFDLEYYRYAKKIAIIDAPTYLYRVTPGSLTKTYRFDRMKKIIHMMQYLSTRMEEFGISEEARLRIGKAVISASRTCILQEWHNPDRSIANRIHNVHMICSDTILQEQIAKYPIKQLSFTRRAYVFLVKNKAAAALYFLLYFMDGHNQA